MNERQLYMAIGKRIRQLREECGISQKELADRCNFEASNMNRIEAGRTNLTLSSIHKISQALNLPFYKITEKIE